MGKGISGLARLVPQFALGNGLMNMSFMPILGFFDNTVYTPLDSNIAGDSLVYMAICSVVYFVLLLTLERCVRPFSCPQAENRRAAIV